MPDFLKNIFAFEANSPLLFTQFYFWAFFAIVYAFMTLFRNKCLMRNSFLFFVSLFFYYKASGLFVLLLLFVIISSFVLSKALHHAPTRFLKRFFLVTTVLLDLSLLCYFKYSYFIADVIQELLGYDIEIFNVFAWAGNELGNTTLFSVDSIILPVGISFFTFQVISYSIDIYRQKIEPIRNLLDFGFYVSFFPQLVAGPIVRASEFIPQLHKPFHLSRRQFGIAIFWIMNGLCKKLILSDYIAINFVDRVFDTPMLFSGFENLVALFAYSLQVYADFSGYTDIAIGVAMLMGFYLPKNFNSPYKAVNVSDFWRRWHISLSTWLRDYLYIPLGGNRKASFGTYFWIGFIAIVVLILSGSIYAALCVVAVALIMLLIAWLSPQRRLKITTDLNSFVTMLLGGLWHGASWNFMLWGGLNGVGLIAYKLWKNMAWHWRAICAIMLNAIVIGLCIYMPHPLYYILIIWISTICVVTLLRYIYHLLGMQAKCHTLAQIWGVAQTFVFITFTRLFFRAGSNLNPEQANEQAWNTATQMIHQIGSTWNVSIIDNIILEYRSTFVVIALGMFIHWLPQNFKRWYRINIALLPIPIMVLLVVALVFTLYQFISADLQSFIYFQF